MGSSLTLGIIGVGKISTQYFETLRGLPQVRPVAVADLDAARASAVAAERGLESLGVAELLSDPRIDVVLNLTVPAAHAEVTVRALESGKHVYTEKPLAIAPDEAGPLLEIAAARGLRVGCAPDTVLGTGIQTARWLLDQGAIGTAVGAAASWTSPGHELWHPAPQFYYRPGGGPLHDMGPYYLSALVTLLGPVTHVAGSASRSARERRVATGPSAGQPIPVEVDTHVSALLTHESGAASTVTLSFDVWASRASRIELYGTAGTIAVPDPNRFSDPVEFWAEGRWRVAEPSAGYLDGGRGIGVADLALALAAESPHRASAELGFHVLEVMDSILAAAVEHRVVSIRSRPPRPAPVPLRDLRAAG